MLDAINDKISSILYEFEHDDALKPLGIKDQLMAIEDSKKEDAAAQSSDSAAKESYPTHDVYCRRQLSY